MQLTVRQLLDLYVALQSLDGYQKVVKDEVAKTERVAFLPYAFSGKARWNLSKALTLAKRASEDLSKVKDGIIKEVSDGGEKIDAENTAQIRAFNVKLNEALDVKEEVSILQVTLEDLNLDANPIPGSILSALSLIVKES